MLGGRDKCQRAIDAGYYDSRKVKTPSGSVEEVRYVEGIEEEIATSSAQCAFTGQKKLTQEEATKKLKELTTNAKLMKKPCRAELMDNADQTSTSSGKQNVMKKPGAHMKRPAGVALNTKSVEDMKKMELEENEAINNACINALSKLRSKELTISQTIASISFVVPANAREEKQKQSWLTDLEEMKTKIATEAGNMMHNIANGKALSFHDHKLTQLKNAADSIGEVDSLLDEINTMVKKRNKAQQQVLKDKDN